MFVVSWVNPDERQARKSFEHYMREGIFASLDVIEKITGSDEVNAVGYCVGGTLLSVALAYMAATGDERISIGDAVRHPGRFHLCRRPQSLRRRGADRGTRKAR